MELDLNKITEKIPKNNFIKNFLKELSETLDNFNEKNEIKTDKIEEIKLTQEEDLELYRKESEFLQNYFKKELSDLSNGEIYLVTNKYENDNEYHRYKVAQYINKHERKYIALKKDLPENVKIGDVVRKVNGKYIYDKKATQYVKNSINKIKCDIINKR